MQATTTCSTVPGGCQENDQAAFDPNSGTASLSTALIVADHPSRSLSPARNPFAQGTHWRLLWFRRHHAGDSYLDAGSSLANKISFSRSPGRMPVNTISMS